VPNLYEINTILWLGELSQKYGKPINLGNVPKPEWDRLKSLGFDYVWLMGVWRRSEIGRKIAREAPELQPGYAAALPGWSPEDVLGSPYSIAAYQPDDRIGDWDALTKAHDQLGRRGIGLVLDLVTNHTAIDFPWVKRFSERYVTGTEQQFRADPASYVPITTRGRTTYFAKGRDPFFPPWHDTLQLNAFHAGTRAAVSRLVKDLSKRCEGLRCDMAMLALNDIFQKTWGDHLHSDAPTTEFWFDLISNRRDLLWIAEAYWDTEWRLQQLGFDFVYDKRLYDRLLHAQAHEIRLHLHADIDFQSKLLRFLENHDELRSVAALDRPRLKAAIVLLATLPGMKLYHHGQLEGRRRKIPVQLGEAAPEEPDAELLGYYQKLLKISRDRVFSTGEWRLIDPRDAGDGTYSNFIAYSWKTSQRMKLIVVNFSPSWGQARIPLKLDGARQTVELIDELQGEKYVRSVAETENPGLHVILDGYHSHLFDIKG